MKVNISKWPKNSTKERKIDIDIKEYDVWNLDRSLALIILPSLILLKASKQGVPQEFATVGGEDWDRQLSFDFYAETTQECFDIAIKDWDEVLEKIIWSFQQLALEDYEDKYQHGSFEHYWQPTGTQVFNPLTGQMEDTFSLEDIDPDKHWFDNVGLRMHNDRIQEGLELFGKYYRNLWD